MSKDRILFVLLNLLKAPAYYYGLYSTGESLMFQHYQEQHRYCLLGLLLVEDQDAQ
jgi:hypothetical protein